MDTASTPATPGKRRRTNGPRVEQWPGHCARCDRTLKRFVRIDDMELGVTCSHKVHVPFRGRLARQKSLPLEQAHA